MTVKELRAFFKDHLVPDGLYKLDGRHNKRICLEKTESGWDVFFSEHKNKVGIMHFNDEASACTAMKNELRKMMEVMYGVTWAAV